jgi:hypothetical protein
VALTREKQIEKLRQMGRGNLLEYAVPVSAGLVAALFIGGWVTGWVALYFIGAFIAIVAISSFTTMRNIRNAVVGEREGMRVRGRVQITVIAGAETPTYSVAARDRGVRWSFEFLPLDWLPATGETDAELVYLRGVEWPVLLIVEAGLIVPRYQPKRT